MFACQRIKLTAKHHVFVALRIRSLPFFLGSPGREVAAPGDDRAVVEGFKGDTCTVVTFLCDGPQLVKGPQEVRIEWLVNGLFHLYLKMG